MPVLGGDFVTQLFSVEDAFVLMHCDDADKITQMRVFSKATKEALEKINVCTVYDFKTLDPSEFKKLDLSDEDRAKAESVYAYLTA